MKRLFLLVSLFLGVYTVLCGLIYLLQEKLIFFPDKLDRAHRFDFPEPFEEMTIQTTDKKALHGLLFSKKDANGLIFYLHGNGGSLERWGEVAPVYLDSNYDVFLLDYRGYGKSEGAIKSEAQLFNDVQTAYSEMLKLYDEAQIIVLGYSIGTGPAAKVASTNNPKLLILQSPYYSLTDVVNHTIPYIPSFLLKYKLETYRYVKDCSMPIVLIHGDRDEVIPYSQSLKLRPLLKESDILITLEGQPHNGMTFNPEYVKEIQKVLVGVSR
jgi:pimeloyl-ACP methyl ester carboxylesterase